MNHARHSVLVAPATSKLEEIEIRTPGPGDVGDGVDAPAIGDLVTGRWGSSFAELMVYRPSTPSPYRPGSARRPGSASHLVASSRRCAGRGSTPAIALPWSELGSWGCASSSYWRRTRSGSLSRSTYGRTPSEPRCCTALPPHSAPVTWPSFTHRYPLRDIDRAYADLRAKPDGFVKALIVMTLDGGGVVT